LASWLILLHSILFSFLLFFLFLFLIKSLSTLSLSLGCFSAIWYSFSCFCSLSRVYLLFLFFGCFSVIWYSFSSFCSLSRVYLLFLFLFLLLFCSKSGSSECSLARACAFETDQSLKVGRQSVSRTREAESPTTTTTSTSTSNIDIDIEHRIRSFFSFDVWKLLKLRKHQNERNRSHSGWPVRKPDWSKGKTTFFLNL
jgi:hypothetical protein